MEYKQIIQNGLDILKKELETYLETKLRDCYGDEFFVYMESGPKVNPNKMVDVNLYNTKNKYKDVLFYLNAFIKNWEFPFKSMFNGHNYPLTLCHSIKYFRNRWAHQSVFTIRETYRLFDECQALLEELKLDTTEIEIIRKGVLEMLVTEETKPKCKIDQDTKKPITGSNLNTLIENTNYNPNLNYQVNNNSNNINSIYQNNNQPWNSSLINTNTNSNVSNNYNNNYNYDDDDIMMVCSNIDDKDLQNDLNYQKLIMEQIQNKNNPLKISYYDETGENDKK
jgi:hypothetical protein